MKNALTLAVIAANALLAGITTPASAETSAGASAGFSEEITITAIRADRKSRGATGLDMDAFDTPQSLSIIGAETIEAFGLNDVNTLLHMTPGVNVDAAETDRTYYNARGFDITSMHTDGIGLPFGTLIVGDLDTFLYDKVEVIKGSNGLITGLGNPSGTVNYVRKRPTNTLAGSANVSVGNYGQHRAELDVSKPLTDSGSWATRVVGVYSEADSWLDHYRNDRLVGSIIVDGQLTSNLTVTAGYAHQDNKSDGVLWGALPVIYNDGRQADYAIDTSTTMDWTHWNTLREESFLELGWQINDAWRLTATGTHTDYSENSELFYIYANTGLNSETGLGLLSYPGKYDDQRTSRVLDANLQGSFDAWGQEHAINMGATAARSDAKSFSHAALTGFQAMPAFPGWTGDEVARPTFAAPALAAHQDIDLNRVYGSVRLALTHSFNLILGVNAVDYTNEGDSYGVATDSNEDGSSPYVGVTWELLDGVNAYASFSDIYQPQYVLGEDLQSLGSAEGRSYEIGVKKSFATSLLSLAVFRTEQSNLQEFKAYGDGDGVDDTDYSDDFNYAIYRGVDVESEGIEIEYTGALTDTLTLQAGATHLSLKDQQGEDARSFIPRNTAKMLLSWQPTQLDSLTAGASLRWQDDIYFDSGYGRIKQGSYAVLGLYGAYQVIEDLTLALNLDNLTNEKYFNSVKYEQAWYAAPRTVALSARWQL
ncbi:TonB-dependent siderophore receptor [Simiduia aestuariiviva]|uniref:Outer membrane receptor for ferric coprogen and ferric-rhodotorulic acid n=1 Tax=Simiduia aestuariiviva TaxID=1510459 RepID=A0A839UH80_9GAMM|nr:TonB-dependent siderophore receptor [Simiduia aestuariiviva]MBB3167394.1 outer membrane receptor for ferric coprogen and ferric-rhodotorulic acid [Simiduia aestuariiviva]